MTPREIDARIAEVMGFAHECQLVGTGVEGDPMRLEPQGAVYRRRSPADHYWDSWSPDGAEVIIQDTVPHYSTDIRAAWPVVEKLRNEGWYVSIFANCRPHMVETVFVEFYRGRDGAVVSKPARNSLPRDTQIVCAEANVLPIAICLAVLKAVRAEVPA